MKRGWITWDKQEIAPAVFEQRMGRVREVLTELSLPALVVYSELWRSNSARFLSNYMPYFNRALLILPLEGSPTLLCGLSPRVYGWIRSVTTIEDVRPAGNFVRPLAELTAERGWNRLGCLEVQLFPHDLHKALTAQTIEMVSVDLDRVCPTGADNTELAMRRKTVALTRQALADEMPAGVGRPDHRFVGRLERRLRRQGIEDLITLVTNGDATPAPPLGAILKPHYSVSLAVEYRGHWVRVSRPHASEETLVACKDLFDAALGRPNVASAMCENLSGSYPYECIDSTDLRPGALVGIHVELEQGGRRFFYGDTCIYDQSGLHTL